jgi:molecular chaperone DnaK
MQYIGIDFGTTNTSVVWVNDDEYGRKITFLGENGEYPFSSIVAIPKKNGDKLLFGRKIREQRLAFAKTHEVHTSMKSFLGTSESFFVGGKRYYPKDITTAFLQYIKEYVKRNYRDGNNNPIDITAASFAFPVDFSPEARRELCEAAKNAGIEVKAFVSESTAAYIANRAEGGAFSKVMVLDWGGGTLDISILRLTGTSIHEISVWGDHIGGDDIDRELAERIHAKIASDNPIYGGRFEDMRPDERDQMLIRCEEAKISISDDGEDYPLTVRNYGAYGTKNTTITEERFNSIVEPIIRSRILKAINDALNKAGGLTPASIDGVIVVGGSSNLRLFEYAVTNMFKDARIIVPEKLQWSTATGAALIQIIGGNFRLSEMVGVKLSDDSIYEVLPQDCVINEPIDPITFSLTEDALCAHFIFTDSTGKSVYAKKSVPTKGFLKEELVLSAVIDNDQIARINIVNKNMGNTNKSTPVELNKLTFHYDITALGESD